MRLFFYGTLRDADMRRAVFGARAGTLSVRPAILPGYRPYRATGGDYPVLVRRTGARVRGQLVEGLGRTDLLRLFHFEGPHFVPSRQLVVEPSGRRLEAWVLLPDRPRRASAKPWCLRRWQRHRKPRMMLRLRIWMLEFHRFESHSVDIAWPLRRRLEAWRESGDLTD